MRSPTASSATARTSVLPSAKGADAVLHLHAVGAEIGDGDEEGFEAEAAFDAAGDVFQLAQGQVVHQREERGREFWIVRAGEEGTGVAEHGYAGAERVVVPGGEPFHHDVVGAVAADEQRGGEFAGRSEQVRVLVEEVEAEADLG